MFYPSPMAKYIDIINGRQTPTCEVCHVELALSVEDRLRRLEDMVAELRGDLEHMMEAEDD